MIRVLQGFAYSTASGSDSAFRKHLIRNTRFRSSSISALAKHVLGSAVLLLLLCNSVTAQTTTTTDGTTPSGLAPGSSSGSYALGGLDNVNLYNGNLSFALPLMQIGGRGSAGYEMTLALNTKSWRVQKIYVPQSDAYKFKPIQNWWGVAAGFSPGMLGGRQMGVDYAPNACYGVGGNYPVYPTKGMTTLTFAAPDGTEYELRDCQYKWAAIVCRKLHRSI